MHDNKSEKEIPIFRTSHEYENIRIVEVDGVKRVQRLKDNKIIMGADANALGKEFSKQFSNKKKRFNDVLLRMELEDFLRSTHLSISEFVKGSEILNYSLVWKFINLETRITLDVINEIKWRIDNYVPYSK